jgi:hypothetical protein
MIFQSELVDDTTADTSLDKLKSSTDSLMTTTSGDEDMDYYLRLPAINEEIYDCCICRLSSKATPERPIGVVTLLQSTSG